MTANFPGLDSVGREHLIIRRMAIILVLVFLGSIGMMGCGGGGGGDFGDTTPATTELEGTWVYSSDNHPIGGGCGLDPHGYPGERITIQFNYNQYTVKGEDCVILSGNTGFYWEVNSQAGKFVIGDIYVIAPDPEDQMREIDFISETTLYSSYNLTGNNLHIATITETYDGTTPEKRAFITASFWDPASNRWIYNPTFIRQ